MIIEVKRCNDGCVCIRLHNSTYCLTAEEARRLLAGLTAVLDAPELIPGLHG